MLNFHNRKERILPRYFVPLRPHGGPICGLYAGAESLRVHMRPVCENGVFGGEVRLVRWCGTFGGECAPHMRAAARSAG